MALGNNDAPAQYSARGRWTTIPNPSATVPDSMAWDGPVVSGSLDNGGGTHLALLRGNGDSTWVIHWHSGLSARRWLVKPGQDTTRGFKVGIGPNLFCAGHSVLADGRLLVVGGTRAGVSGLAKAHVFDPKAYGSGGLGNGWTELDTTKSGRWYPTQTMLGNGKTLITSGYEHDHMILYGGDSTGVLPDLRAMR